jgi:Helicase conserved C-terminal domain
MCETKEGTLPASIIDWEQMKSKKLEVLVDVVKYHLATDGAPPMQMAHNQVVAPSVPQAPSVSIAEDLDQTRTTPSSTEPSATKPTVNPPLDDKLVVLSVFPSNNALIKCVRVPLYIHWRHSTHKLLQILDLHGVRYVEINGYMSPAERSAAVKTFRDAGRNGPRVLILSQVGMTGLNLPFACILVMLVCGPVTGTRRFLITSTQDTLWSAQDDRQLIGRLWRPPQLKTVHVYRLIANNTSDVFLNNISFDKAAMHLAFTNSGAQLSMSFN